jgi:glucans biosynthesis protein
MLVSAVLFPRVELTEVGLAPATSMFMFSASGRGDVDDFRPQVHDSDGPVISAGEHRGAPANPTGCSSAPSRTRGREGWPGAARPEPGRLPGPRGAFSGVRACGSSRPATGEGRGDLTEIPPMPRSTTSWLSAPRPIARAPAPYLTCRGVAAERRADRLRVVATVGQADVKAPTPARRFVIDYSPALHRAAPVRAAERR